MTKESVDVAYVTLTPETLANDKSIKITEAELRDAYQSERKAAPDNEERKARHILLKTGKNRTPEEAKKELEAIKARVEAGESFSAIAKKVSEDAGSAAEGGELGYLDKSTKLAPEFEKALFALKKPGDISEPVKTSFGYHLIQLEQIRKHDYPSFEQARNDVEQRLRKEKAGSLYSQRLRQMDNLAFENAQSLDAIVKQLGLEKQTAKGVTRNQGPPPFDDPQVRQRLFSTDVLDKGFNSAAVEYGDKKALVMRVIDRHEPKQIPFDKVSGKIRTQIQTERAQALAQKAFEKARDSLQSGASAAQVAADAGTDWKTFELVRRNAHGVPQDILQQAFELPRPGKDAKSIGSAGLPGGGTALITVTQVENGQLDALTDAEVQGMRSFLAKRAARLDFNGFFETVRAEATIKRADKS